MNFFVASVDRSLDTFFVISRSPVFLVFVNAAVAAVVLIVPPIVPVEGATVNLPSDVSVTVYSTPTGSPLTVAVWPPLSLTVPVPLSSNVTSPYFPLIAGSSCTVNVNSTFLSEGCLLVTVFVIFRSPFLRVLVALATTVLFPTVPSWLSQPTTKLSSDASVTLYFVPVGRPAAVAVSPFASATVASPLALNVMSPYFPLTAGSSFTVKLYSLVISDG